MKKTKTCVYVYILVILATMMLSAIMANAAIDDSAVISINLVNQDPDPAIAGDVVEVRLGVQNIGGSDSGDIMVELVPEYPFTLVSGESAVQGVGIISGYQGYDDTTSLKIIKYKVMVDKDATAGSYELKTKYYDKGSLSAVQKSLSIDVNSRESAEIIHIDKTTLMPGQQSSLKFIINNVGSAPLRDLTFYWENDDDTILPVGSDNTRYIKYIDVGESAELEYQVIADTNADAGLYKLNLYLTYYNSLNDSEKTISTIAGMYVGGGTDFDVAFSESSSSQISFTIANIGSNSASSVSVIVPQQSGWRVTGANSMIIGNLNVGDYTVASFTLQSVQSMPGNFTPGAQNQRINMTQASKPNNLKIQIAYTDTMGTRKVVDKEVAINQQSSSSTTSTTGTASQTGMPQFGRTRQQNFFVQYKWYIIAFFVLAALVLLVVFRTKYKKEKLLNPNFKVKELFKKKEKTNSGTGTSSRRK